MRTEYTENLRPLLERFGLEPGFHLVLFAVDETVYSREVAPLAGFYPSVFIGAPWWFLDAPDAILRLRSAVTETAGFYRGRAGSSTTPGRSSRSPPATTWRAASTPASSRGSSPRDASACRTAQRIARDLVDAIPREVFKL